MADVTTVIVTRDRCEQLLAMVGSVGPPVVVVDNGSRDGSADAVEAAFPDTTVVRLPRDCGVEGFNAGARAARTRYVAFADDCCWWERKTLALGARTFDEHPTLGLISAAVNDVSNGPDPVSRALSRSPLTGRQGLPGTPVLGFVACACLVRRQPFLDVGGFDTLSGLGGEEQRVALDLADAGWAIRFRDDINVWADRSWGGRRRRVEVRDEVLTALMRRPIRVAMLRAWQSGRQDLAGLLGVFRALPLMPVALHRRKLMSARIETRARMIDQRTPSR